MARDDFPAHRWCRASFVLGDAACRFLLVGNDHSATPPCVGDERGRPGGLRHAHKNCPAQSANRLVAARPVVSNTVDLTSNRDRPRNRVDFTEHRSHLASRLPRSNVFARSLHTARRGHKRLTLVRSGGSQWRRSEGRHSSPVRPITLANPNRADTEHYARHSLLLGARTDFHRVAYHGCGCGSAMSIPSLHGRGSAKMSCKSEVATPTSGQ